MNDADPTPSTGWIAWLSIALVLQGATSGCLTPTGDQEPWWQPPPEDRFPSWPGLDAPAARAPNVPWLEGYLQDRAEATQAGFERLDAAGIDPAMTLAPERSLERALRYLEAGSTLWTLGPLVSANNSIVYHEEVFGLDGPDPGELDAFLERERPVAAFRALMDALDRGFEQANTTGIPLLMSVLVNAVSPLSAVDRLAGDEGSASDRDAWSVRNMGLAAATIVAYVRHAGPIVENATRLPGPAASAAKAVDLDPLLDVSDRVARKLEPLADERSWSGLIRAPIVLADRALEHQEDGWTWAAATRALQALVVAERLHRFHEGSVPTTDEVLDALSTVDGTAAPGQVLFSHLAWRDYLRAEDDPSWMVVPVSMATLWPLASKVHRALADPTVDSSGWGPLLQEHVDRWEASWFASVDA